MITLFINHTKEKNGSVFAVLSFCFQTLDDSSVTTLGTVGQTQSCDYTRDGSENQGRWDKPSHVTTLGTATGENQGRWDKPSHVTTLGTVGQTQSCDYTRDGSENQGGWDKPSHVTTLGTAVRTRDGGTNPVM